MGLPGKLIVVVLSVSIMTSSQCKAEGLSNARVTVYLKSLEVLMNLRMWLSFYLSQKLS